MENLDIKPHTIVITVAPSGAGKSYFCTNYLLPKLKHLYSEGLLNKKANIQYLSSDGMRMELFGNDLPKLTRVGENISKQSFNLLETKLDLVTSYPISAEVVVVDTMGMNRNFIQFILQVADKNCYNVCFLLFDYETEEQYLEHTPESEQWLTKQLMKDFEKEVEYVKSFVKDYKFRDKNSKQVYTIRNKKFDLIPITVSNLQEYNKVFVSDEYDYSIVGDVHGCLEEFKAMVFKLGFSIDKNDIMHEMKPKK